MDRFCSQQIKNKKEGDIVMRIFLLAALPWVALGIAVAVLIANFRKKGKGIKNGGNKERNPDSAGTNPEKPNHDSEDNYMSVGMSLGMCFGVAIGSSFTGAFGATAISYGICFGMLIGMVAGLLIKKK